MYVRREIQRVFDGNDSVPQLTVASDTSPGQPLERGVATVRDLTPDKTRVSVSDLKYKVKLKLIHSI